jgi:predicted dithiol-disulfide oxidoreductase (DUF899 family)
VAGRAQDLLAREKEATRAKDAVDAARRAPPMTEVGKRCMFSQLQRHPPVPVRAVGILERLRDQQLQLVFPFRRRRLRPGPPVIKPGS